MEEKLVVNEDYKITESTMFISPHFHEVYRSMIFDEKGIYLCSKRPLKLIEEACIDDGASFDGRRQAVIQKLNYKVKTPIHISPERMIYAFPTISFLSYDCTWIFANNIKDIEEINKYTSEIIFRNGYRYTLKLPRKILMRQREKTALCMYIFSPIKRLQIQFTPLFQ